MRPVGVHYLGEFFNCSCIDLDDSAKLAEIIENAVIKNGFSLVETVSHRFNPVGVTVVCIIGESHIAVHSYPEASHITIDVFTCSGNPSELFFYLKDKFEPSEFKFRKFFRGKELLEVESNMVVTASNYGLDVQYLVSDWILSKKTAYQKVDVIINPQFGKMVFLDNNLQLSEYDHTIYDNELLSGVEAYKKNSQILILGGGDGTLLSKLKNRGFVNIEIVDIDQEFVEISSNYLKDMNHDVLNDFDGFHFADAGEFLEECTKKFDIIISDMTVYPESFTTQNRESYFCSLFSSINEKLKPEGIFRFQCSSVYDIESSKLFSRLLGENFSDLKFNKRYIPSYCKEWLFGTASN